MQKRKYFFLFLVISFLFTVGCSEYNKVLKSPNIEYKYKKSVEYYEEEEYSLALPLLEELIPLYKGTDKGQKIYYYYCYSNYHLGFYITAAYVFKKFAETFPRAKEAEEALFMSAYCNFLDSPKATLDQEPTYRALEELQLFVNTYPKSELVDSANTLVDMLEGKLETKAFENCKQYYKIRKFKSAVVAINNLQTDYPDSKYEEEAKLLILKSYYYLAINSIESKKKERFNLGVEAYYDFIDNFADGEKVKEAEGYFDKLTKARDKYNSENS